METQFIPSGNFQCGFNKKPSLLMIKLFLHKFDAVMIADFYSYNRTDIKEFSEKSGIVFTSDEECIIKSLREEFNSNPMDFWSRCYGKAYYTINKYNAEYKVWKTQQEEKERLKKWTKGCNSEIERNRYILSNLYGIDVSKMPIADGTLKTQNFYNSLLIDSEEKRLTETAKKKEEEKWNNVYSKLTISDVSKISQA